MEKSVFTSARGPETAARGGCGKTAAEGQGCGVHAAEPPKRPTFGGIWGEIGAVSGSLAVGPGARCAAAARGEAEDALARCCGWRRLLWREARVAAARGRRRALRRGAWSVAAPCWDAL